MAMAKAELAERDRTSEANRERRHKGSRAQKGKRGENPPRPTWVPKQGQLEMRWHIIDADGKVLGRLASEVAVLLRGKHKPTFTPNVNTGDGVIVVNASKIVVTGKKVQQKKVRTHSGYPGGLKETIYEKAHETDPAATVTRAVRGMLPKTTLGREQLSHLRVYAGKSHLHSAQHPVPHSLDEDQRQEVHQNGEETCNAGDPDTPDGSEQSKAKGSEGVTVHRLTTESYELNTYEAEDGDFFAAFRSDSVRSYGWHTSLEPREALRICADVAIQLDRTDKGTFALGYEVESKDEVTAARNLSLKELTKALVSLPTSALRRARLETAYDSFLWEAASQVLAVTHESTLAVISGSMSGDLLKELWKQTTSDQVPDLQRAVQESSSELKAS